VQLAALEGGLPRIVSGDEEPLESFMARDPAEWRRQHWEREHAAREAAWQTPAAIIAALDTLLDAIHGLPAEVSRLDISDDYFTEGAGTSKKTLDPENPDPERQRVRPLFRRVTRYAKPRIS
jgi:hypothetical protein